MFCFIFVLLLLLVVCDVDVECDVFIVMCKDGMFDVLCVCVVECVCVDLEMKIFMEFVVCVL